MFEMISGTFFGRCKGDALGGDGGRAAAPGKSGKHEKSTRFVRVCAFSTEEPPLARSISFEVEGPRAALRYNND